jgi:hypothetical protein
MGRRSAVLQQPRFGQQKRAGAYRSRLLRRLRNALYPFDSGHIVN